MTKQTKKAAPEAAAFFLNDDAARFAKSLMLEGVNKSQDAGNKWAMFCKDMVKTYEGLCVKAAANMRTVNDKMLDNAAMGANAAFDHAADVAKLADVNDVAKRQVSFAREQIAVINDQHSELYGLTSAIARDMVETGTEAARSAAEKLKSLA